MRLLIFSFFTFCCISFVNAQTFLLQEDFSAGIPAGWQVIDADGHPLHPSMSQFTNAWISYDNGSDTTVASSSYFDDTLQAADYLILPKQSLQTFSKLSWEARSVDASYPDGYYVLLSTTDSNLTSFTDTLKIVYAENFQWVRHSVHLDTMGFANQDVFIAFRNFTMDGFILELDDIWLEVSDFAGIEEHDVTPLFYPNPVENELNIVTPNVQQIEILDYSGRLLLTSSQTSINISDLIPGQYIVRITTTTNVVSEPFIKL